MNIVAETHEYKDGDTLLEGYYAYNQDATKPMPLVLIVHTWSGLDDAMRQHAHALAKQGYCSFAIDVFGKDRRGETNEQCAALIAPFKEDRKHLQQRVLCALEVGKQFAAVDPLKTAAIGFCFGGMAVLDLARTGEKIAGAVSFHGLLDAPQNNHELKDHPLNAKILVLHGNDDPLVPHEQLFSFTQEMDKRHANWEVDIYGAAAHSFTNKNAKDTSLGLMYNSQANSRSFQSMYNFLEELFGEPLCH